MHDVSIPAALLAGIISFLSPCVLPLVPPYLIYLTGATIEHVANEKGDRTSRRAVMMAAVIFVLGFSTVFVALGASASFIGGLIRTWSAQLSIVAGIVIIIMGLHFLGLTRIGLLMREGRLPIPKPVGLWGAYVMGLAFAFGWTPCIGTDPGRNPLDGRSRGDGGEGRGPARGLLSGSWNAVFGRGLHG